MKARPRDGVTDSPKTALAAFFLGMAMVALLVFEVTYWVTAPVIVVWIGVVAYAGIRYYRRTST